MNIERRRFTRRRIGKTAANIVGPLALAACGPTATPRNEGKERSTPVSLPLDSLFPIDNMREVDSTELLVQYHRANQQLAADLNLQKDPKLKQALEELDRIAASGNFARLQQQFKAESNRTFQIAKVRTAGARPEDSGYRFTSRSELKLPSTGFINGDYPVVITTVRVLGKENIVLSFIEFTLPDNLLNDKNFEQQIRQAWDKNPRSEEYYELLNQIQDFCQDLGLQIFANPAGLNGRIAGEEIGRPDSSPVGVKGNLYFQRLQGGQEQRILFDGRIVVMTSHRG